MEERRVIGVYDSLPEAERRLEFLSRQGLTRQRMSVHSASNARDLGILGSRTTGGYMMAGARWGALWGAGVGLLVSFLIFAVAPGAEPWPMRLLAMFLLGVTLGGLSGVILGGLSAFSLGRDKLGHNHDQLLSGKYVVTLYSTESTATDVRALLADIDNLAAVFPFQRASGGAQAS